MNLKNVILSSLCIALGHSVALGAIELKKYDVAEIQSVERHQQKGSAEYVTVRFLGEDHIQYSFYSTKLDREFVHLLENLKNSKQKATMLVRSGIIHGMILPDGRAYGFSDPGVTD